MMNMFVIEMRYPSWLIMPWDQIVGYVVATTIGNNLLKKALMIAMIFLDICLTMDIPCIKVKKNDKSKMEKGEKQN